MIFVTGGGGNLATELKKYCGNNQNIRFLMKKEFNILSPEKIQQFCGKNQVDRIFHFAGYTDVKKANTNKNSEKACFNINVEGTRNIVNLCKKRKIPLLYVSSYYVYENQGPPSDESISFPPTTPYALSKYEAENIIQKELEVYTILRLGSLFGGDLDEKFINKIVDKYKTTDEKIYVDNEKQFQPCYTPNIVEMIYKLFVTSNIGNGLFNFGNTGLTTRYEFVKKIFEYAGFDITRLEPVKSKYFEKESYIKNYGMEMRRLKSMGIFMVDIDYVAKLYANTIKIVPPESLEPKETPIDLIQP